MNVVGKINPLTLYIYDGEAEHLIAGRPWLEAFQPAAPWIRAAEYSTKL